MLQNRYRIISPLGQGGMGTVYRAQHTQLDVSVAVKEMVPQPGLDLETLAQLRHQFLREAQILARLNHPHLVRVSDFFEEGGSAYLVMDFVEGESLSNRIGRQGSLSERTVLAWAEQLLDALAYCHAQGVIHRDVKPQNVIIRPDRRAVLVDFGLVKLWDPNDPYTKTAMRGMGTPEYAPPEQYDVQIGHTDARSDIYALGATLYHALCGQAPPTATLRIADPERFMPPRDMAPGISKRTGAALVKSLELARSQRWQNMAEMAQALGVAVPGWEGEKTTERGIPDARGGTWKLDAAAPSASAVAPAVAPVAEPVPERRRVPVWDWVLGGLAALALVVGIAIGAVGMIKRNASTPTPAVEQTTTVATPVDETATAILSPSPSPSPTAAATASPGPTHTPTRTPTHTPTATPAHTPSPTPTATATETPPPLPTATPAPQARAPSLTTPDQGGTYKSPVTFQWAGSLGTTQSYQVTAYHAESRHTLQSGPLTAQSWTIDLPGDKVGEWHWSVSVVQDGSVVAASIEWVFWFNPIDGGGGDGNGGGNGNGGDDKPTPKP
jgi:serine/threonine-protein kinase